MQASHLVYDYLNRLQWRNTISNKKPGEILVDITARGKGYGVPFKGKVDQISDLEDLVKLAPVKYWEYCQRI